MVHLPVPFDPHESKTASTCGERPVEPVEGVEGVEPVEGVEGVAEVRCGVPGPAMCGRSYS